MYLVLTQCFASRIGGIEDLMTNFALTLASRENVKVFADQNLIAQDEIFDKKNINSIEVFRYGGIKFFRQRKKSKDIKIFIENNEIQAIISDTWKSLERCIDYLKDKKIKTVCLAHGNDIIFKDERRKERILNVYNKVDKIIANSRYTSDLIKTLNIEDQKIFIVNPGAKNLDEVNASNNFNFEGNPILFTLARLEKRKGHQKVLEALKKLKDDFPNIQYIIAGEGSEKKNLVNLTTNLDLTESVFFVGSVNQSQKKEIFNHSTLMVMPTTNEVSMGSIEGFGISYIEAAMAGLCSVATDNGGVSDAIINNETGLLLKPNDDLYSSLKNILSDSKKIKLFNLQAKKRALEDFNWDVVIEKYLNIIRN
mgnify:CR=1 FL=1